MRSGSSSSASPFFFPARVPRTKKKNMFLVVVFHDVPTHRGRPLKLFFLSPLTSTCPMARAHIGKRKIKMGKGGMRRLLLNIVGIGLRVVVDLLRATQLRQVVDLLRATRRRRCFRSSIEEAMRWRCFRSSIEEYAMFPKLDEDSQVKWYPANSGCLQVQRS